MVERLLSNLALILLFSCLCLLLTWKVLAVTAVIAFLATEAYCWLGKRGALPRIATVNESGQSLVLVYVLVIIGVIFTAGKLHQFSFSKVSLVLVLIGCYFRVMARWELGREYEERICVHEDHRLSSKGLFRLCRHPYYVGMLLQVIAFGLLFHNNAMGTLFLGLSMVLFYRERVRVEEPLLLEHLPDYADYRAATPVLPSPKSLWRFLQEERMIPKKRSM